MSVKAAQEIVLRSSGDRVAVGVVSGERVVWCRVTPQGSTSTSGGRSELKKMVVTLLMRR